MAKAVYRCKQGMVCTLNGDRYHFSGGALVPEDHPVNPKSNPNFEEISEYVERTSQPRHRGVVVEQATAEPGERRSIGRPSRSPKSGKKDAPQAQKEESDGQA